MSKKILGLLLGLSLLAISCNNVTTKYYTGGVVEIDAQKVNVDVADSDATRSLGLGGRASIDDEQGMYFDFDQPARYSFWMKDMSFPIDIIWIAGNQVVDITPNVPTQPGATDPELTTYMPTVPVDHVLEVASGWANRHGVGIGDLVQFTAK